MFAVIKTGGKQYRVAADDVLKIEKVDGEPGDIVQFDHVLMVDQTIGAPLVDGASVAAEILEQGRDRKVIAFKKRRRQNSRRTIGHRQYQTKIQITEILTGGAKPSKKAAVKKPAPAKEAAPKAASAKEAKAAAPKAKETTDSKIVDDITLIGGVGPALKKKLEGYGVTSLKQIAEMKKDDMAKMDEELKLGGRTEREEWAEQAKELLAGKPPRAKVDQKAADEKK